MSPRSKLILSVIGLSAVIIPVLLLVFVGTKKQIPAPISADKRPLNTGVVEETAKRVVPTPLLLPTPSPASPSATPVASP